MTSTDFTYPQPTDDELAAQQPRSPSPHAPLIYSSPGAGLEQYERAPDPSGAAGVVRGARRCRRGAGGRGFGEVADSGEDGPGLRAHRRGSHLAASAILAATIGPTEAASGYYFTDVPEWYQSLATGLVGLQVLCAGMGITAIIMGIVSAVTARGRTFGIIAIAAAAIAPLLSFGTFVALSFVFA
jgi:hypothetical protein